MHPLRKRQRTPEPSHLLLKAVKPQHALLDSLPRRAAFADHFGLRIASFDEFVHGHRLAGDLPMTRGMSRGSQEAGVFLPNKIRIGGSPILTTNPGFVKRLSVASPWVKPNNASAWTTCRVLSGSLAMHHGRVLVDAIMAELV